jgi:hypothetical protein
MATYQDSEEFQAARFVGCDLSGVVMRGVQIEAADIDAPWIFEGDSYFRINGVDVLPFVDAELNRRFPGRELRTAGDPDGLRAAFAALHDSWSALLDRVSTMPAGTVERSVDGEWSFAQTLRHLVLATDMWLGKGILQLDQPFHPLGISDASMAAEGWDMSVFTTEEPSYDEILAARADRVAMVRDFIAGVTADDLAEPRPNSHDPDHQETVLNCLHVILQEEWDHQRYAVRDLDSLAVD